MAPALQSGGLKSRLDCVCCRACKSQTHCGVNWAWVLQGADQGMPAWTVHWEQTTAVWQLSQRLDLQPWEVGSPWTQQLMHSPKLATVEAYMSMFAGSRSFV